MDGGLLTSSDLYAGADVGYRCHTVGVQRKQISTYAGSGQRKCPGEGGRQD